MSDVISNQVINVNLIDRCGGKIPSDQYPIDLCKRQGGGNELFPPRASEACAYDRLGDKLILSLDETQVSDINYDTYLKIYEKESGAQIYEKKLDKLQFDVYTFRRRTVEWPLVNENGNPLEVGREGKQYEVLLTRENHGDVLYTSGIQDILVDDCRLRNDKILQLINDPSIRHNPGFDLYLKLLNSVATRICNKIETGLVGNEGADTFSQRCRYQCINNHFTNKMIDSTTLPLSSNDYLQKTHLKVALHNAEAVHFVDNQRYGNAWVSARFSMLAYITMEDNYRADGYIKCNGPLNSVDAEASIDIIQYAIDEIIIEIPTLGLAGMAEMIISQIRMHLDRTESIYKSKLGEK